MTVAVDLSPFELMHGAIAGVMRQTFARNGGLSDSRYGRPTLDRWSRDIGGALAECAFAKWKGIYWDPGMHFRPEGKRGDVGANGVRSTDRADGGLIVQPDDFGDIPYWLVLTNALPTLVIVGWLPGVEAKRREWFRSLTPGRPPVYCVPQSALLPPELDW